MFDVCTTDDTPHIDTIFKFLPHTRASAWMHGYSSLLQWSVPLGQRRHVAMVGRIPGLWHIPKQTISVTTDILVWYSNTQNYFSPGAAIFSLQTLASPSGRNVNYDEKQNTGERILSCFFYLYRFRKYVSYGFPIINFCIPGVHYEMPCIIRELLSTNDRHRSDTPPSSTPNNSYLINESKHCWPLKTSYGSRRQIRITFGKRIYT
jgi:hypothetical protein